MVKQTWGRLATTVFENWVKRCIQKECSRRQILWISCKCLNQLLRLNLLSPWKSLLYLDSGRKVKQVIVIPITISQLPTTKPPKKWLYKKLCSKKGGKGLEWKISFTCWLSLELSYSFSANVKKVLRYVTWAKRKLSEILQAIWKNVLA